MKTVRTLRVVERCSSNALMCSAFHSKANQLNQTLSEKYLGFNNKFSRYMT